MGKFSRNTGIPFDRVMIFPHEKFSSNTLAILKKHNFLAAFSWSGPIETAKLPTAVELSRSISMKYENFPIVRRNWITDKVSPNSSDIAMELFINGFIVFCSHHDLFEKGIDSFDKYANTVNRIRTDVHWSGLGEIARHLYYERIRDDGDIDVLSFSNEIALENDGKRKRIYHIRKESFNNYPIMGVFVDGRPFDSKIIDNVIMLSLEILPRESRGIRIEYKNDYDPAKVDISKNGLRIYSLRMLSDFRDLVMSRNALSRIIVKSYYKSGIYQYGLIVPVLIILVAVGCMVFTLLIFNKGKIRSRRSK
jgi:hypothetical protein